jgi:hypothetical protein
MNFSHFEFVSVFTLFTTIDRYPFLACEILASEVWAICDAMYQQADLLNQLYTYFDKEAPLNQLLSSYTSRVASTLLQKKVSEVLIRNDFYFFHFEAF